jgi:hypothetical protein
MSTSTTILASAWEHLKKILNINNPSVYDIVMSDLNRVRLNVSDELVRFRFAVVSEKMRGKSLLLLFQKDLLPGNIISHHYWWSYTPIY